MPRPTPAHGGPSPRHRLVAEDLIARIVDGTYQLGDRLPTEEELCTQYGLARGTVRQALDRLHQLGMIERRTRAGTRVIATQPLPPYQPFVATPSEIADLVATTRLLRPQTSEARIDSATARQLGVRAGTTWQVVKGVRVRRDRPELPLCWSEHYFRERRDPARSRDDVRPEALEGLRIEQTVRASLVDDRLALALEAEPGSAALVVIRKVFDRRGRVVNVGTYTHPADRYEIRSTLSNKPTQTRGVV